MYITTTKMKRVSQSPAVNNCLAVRSCPSSRAAHFARALHTTHVKPATVAPITASGHPPKAPVASAQHVDSRVARRRKQAELLKRGQDLRSIAAGSGGGTAKQKRFWNDVHVKHVDGEGLQVHLDKRPIRRPTKSILNIPHHKPHLASALALEWDLLISAQQALRQDLIPLTTLVSWALEIQDEDAAGGNELRSRIVDTVMRYLDTDSLLCWAPEPLADPPGYETHESRTESLRSIQERTAIPIIAYLTERVWPGIEILPDSDASTIMPISQPQMTKDVIRGWVSGLPAFELAGLERACLAGKSLLGAARLLVEWSVELEHLRDATAKEKFGVEEAARASSLEVDFQTGMWGEVEDTHDVNKEDLRRQLGSAVLLVSGERA